MIELYYTYWGSTVDCPTTLLSLHRMYGFLFLSLITSADPNLWFRSFGAGVPKEGDKN